MINIIYNISHKYELYKIIYNLIYMYKYIYYQLFKSNN